MGLGRRALEFLGVKQPPPALPESNNVLPMPTFEPFDLRRAEMYRYRHHYGVNLGSVFVLESWLCPEHFRKSVANGQWDSEMDFLLACDTKEHAREMLEYHWSTFITPQDIEQMAQQGVNTVRIPIGYWIIEPRTLLTGRFKDDAFYRFADVYDAAFGYLMRLVKACEQHNVGVLIDIHAAPGGQNNDAHSGQAKPYAPEFYTSNTAQKYMLDVLCKITRIFTPMNHIIGITLLNEPIDHAALLPYYRQACQAVLDNTPSPCAPLPLYIGDCWMPEKFMDILTTINYPFLVLDSHQYFCHTEKDHRQTAQQHMATVQSKIVPMFRGPHCSAIRGNLSIGEWAMVLNGQSMQGLNERQTLTAFGQLQQQSWQQCTAGSFYWTYKTADDNWYWSLKYCFQQNLLSFRQPEKKRKDPAPLNDEAVIQQKTQDHLQRTTQRLQTLAPQQQQASQSLYQQGLKDGYRVALEQFYPVDIGFKLQLAHDYHARTYPSTDREQQAIAWLYEDGFVDGLDLAYAQ
ncbi:glycoside hydrolase [Hesseltinella vesiculosa]|uniref:Glycoside hydrolase n=1 Tax=Hesseltinella vesiculosa TaxID=101127 RepID=A0A1X2GSD9_9FUNG|nr:glycoside hydrolase [Hesseltinella vesiculosa]